VYERLKQAGVTEVLGFNIPQFIRADDDLRVIEMSIVTRPFVLDFAGAYLDAPPHFPDGIWAEWEAGKREQFETRWPEVEAVLAALEELDLHGGCVAEQHCVRRLIDEIPSRVVQSISWLSELAGAANALRDG
jgi:hypothetical protein